MGKLLDNYVASVTSEPGFGSLARYEAKFPNTTPAWFKGWYISLLNEALAELRTERLAREAETARADKAEAALAKVQSDPIAKASAHCPEAYEFMYELLARLQPRYLDPAPVKTRTQFVRELKNEVEQLENCFRDYNFRAVTSRSVNVAVSALYIYHSLCGKDFMEKREARK